MQQMDSCWFDYDIMNGMVEIQEISPGKSDSVDRCHGLIDD